MTDHIYVKHENCEKDYCMICDGGLALCSVCGALEGALTTECCGEQLTTQQQDEIYAGKIDFINGQWVNNVVSIHSPKANG